jgi:hypothetical protein
MMRIVDFDHEIRNRELQFVDPQTRCHVLRNEPMTRTQELQDVGRLPDDQPPGLEKRRSEGRSPRMTAIQETHQGRHSGSPSGFTRHIPISCARLLQGQSHVLAATLNRRPVIEFVIHDPTSFWRMSPTDYRLHGEFHSPRIG